MTQLGANRVNRHPCTESEEAANWSVIADVVNQISANPDGITISWPFVRFQLNSTFTASLATADVLDAAGTDTGDDITVYDVEGRYGGAAGNEKGYGAIYGNTPVYEVIILADGSGASVDPDTIFNAITIVGGTYDDTTNTFTVTATGSDNFKVKCTSGDTTEEYLHDALKDPQTRDANADPIISNETNGAAATNQKERLFMDSSVIDSYSSIPDGATWALSITRSGATRQVKWAPTLTPFYTVVLDSPISPATETIMTSGSGTVRIIGEGGVLTSIGSRTVFNPYSITLTDTDAIYPCVQTWDDPTVDADDEYTITGVDPLAIIYSQNGAAEKKSLALGEGAADKDDIEWLGGVC